MPARSAPPDHRVKISNHVMLDKVEKGVISNIYLVEPCHSMPQGCHKNGALLDEVEKGAISNVYLGELGHSWTQEWRPAG